MAIDGPTGSGKTWTSLEVARELVGPDGTILLIDTERGSSGLYADVYRFDIVEFEPPFDPRHLVTAINQFHNDYDCIIVDSLTHFWQGEGGTRDIVDKASDKFGGNKFAGWKEGTPAQNEMVDALVNAACHIITTMRSKMEYVLGDDKTVTKIGMAPEQRGGIEYEFTVVGDMDLSHNMTISKSRCDAIADTMYRMGHTVEVATTLRKWLESNEALATLEQRQAIPNALEPIVGDGWKSVRVGIKRDFADKFGAIDNLTSEEADAALAWITEQVSDAVEMRSDAEESTANEPDIEDMARDGEDVEAA